MLPCITVYQFFTIPVEEMTSLFTSISYPSIDYCTMVSTLINLSLTALPWSDSTTRTSHFTWMMLIMLSDIPWTRQKARCSSIDEWGSLPVWRQLPSFQCQCLCHTAEEITSSIGEEDLWVLHSSHYQVLDAHGIMSWSLFHSWISFEEFSLILGVLMLQIKISQAMKWMHDVYELL